MAKMNDTVFFMPFTHFGAYTFGILLGYVLQNYRGVRLTKVSFMI
jgi:hypothetical protein